MPRPNARPSRSGFGGGLPDAGTSRLEEASDELEEKAPSAFKTLEEGFLDATAANALPEKYRKRLRWADMLKRLIQEIWRREKPVRIFPNKALAWRLVGALLSEKHEEWSTGRRYLNMDKYFEWRADRSVEDTLGEETTFNGEQATCSAPVPPKLKIWQNVNYTRFGT